MSLLSLPNETILEIAEHLGPTVHLSNLTQTCLRLGNLLTPTLYKLSLSKSPGHLINWALQKENADLLRLLVEHYHANLDAGDREIPLHCAISYQKFAMLSLLLQLGANPNGTDARGMKKTALHVAARYGEADCIKLLVGAGADVNARDAVGETPLHYAVRWQNKADLVELLLGLGAENDLVSYRGETPGDIAAATGAHLARSCQQMGGWKGGAPRNGLFVDQREQQRLIAELLGGAGSS